MKNALIVIFLIALMTTQAQGQNSIQNLTRMSKTERELREIEETRRNAIKQGDMKTLNAIYADDFSGIVGSGQVINKEQLLAVFKRNDPSMNFTTDEISVRVYGKTAIFTGRLIGKFANGEIMLASRFTHIFIKRGGRWQCVAGQSTAIPKQS